MERDSDSGEETRSLGLGREDSDSGRMDSIDSDCREKSMHCDGKLRLGAVEWVSAVESVSSDRLSLGSDRREKCSDRRFGLEAGGGVAQSQGSHWHSLSDSGRQGCRASGTV